VHAAVTRSRGTAGVAGYRRAFFRESGLVEVPVLARSGLVLNETIQGPTLIEEETTTCVIGPGWSAALDEAGNVTMRSVE
jgi:N-methylhydantoinase A